MASPFFLFFFFFLFFLGGGGGGGAKWVKFLAFFFGSGFPFGESDVKVFVAVTQTGSVAYSAIIGEVQW